ncbi:MAG: inositol monophosphatase [SAR324 cluster bacterium]|nr:inositol monophosphatase [SAR324 cluster bacterium]
MKLTNKDLEKLSQIAIVAARAAGQMIAVAAKSEVQVKTKVAGDSLASQVVTEIDFKAQEIILEGLNPTLETYRLGLLTEESDDDNSRLSKDYFWCIDPLDGTLAFTKKRVGYAVSIALVSRAGIPILGVVFDPTSGTLYHATQGQGAFKNGEKWIVDGYQTNKEKALTLITDQSFKNHNQLPKITKKIEDIATKLGHSGIKILDQGGAVMNAIWVMTNQPAYFVKLPKSNLGGGSLWDYAATACILAELGAHTSDIHGNPLELNREGSTYLNHRGVIFASDGALAKEIIGLVQKTVSLEIKEVQKN